MVLSLPAKEYAPLAYDAPMPDESLITAIAGGSGEAMACLYEQTASAVYGFVLSILKDRHSAEDALQDTYLRVLSAADGYRPQGKPMAWILTIARNAALEYLRKQKKQAVPADDAPDALSAAGEDEDRRLNRLVLDTALQQLPGKDCQIVMLHLAAGFKHREIAEFLRMPLSTVLSRYRRALAKLQKMLLEETP